MVKKIQVLIIGLILVVGVKSAVSQITITPIMLFLDQQQRFGTLLVMNGSDDPQEVSIEFQFGYPTTDEQGNVQMVYDDSVTAEKWGVADAIRGFPKSFTLQAGQRQVVRLTVRPRDFEERMYWSRIRTTSIPATPPVGDVQEESITTQITYKFTQVSTLFYKHGEVQTGIEINSLTTDQTEEQFSIITDLSRTGSAPFLGSIKLNIKDQNGKSVLNRSVSTSIYFDYRHVFDIDKNQLPAGEYTAEVRVVSQRGDVSPADIIHIEPITRSTKLTVK